MPHCDLSPPWHLSLLAGRGSLLPVPPGAGVAGGFCQPCGAAELALEMSVLCRELMPAKPRGVDAAQPARRAS